MGRIAERFDRLRRDGRRALIPFITAGDPDIDTTLGLMTTLVDAGADAIELGVPFSDPMADGPAVQAASERALASGTRVTDVLALVSRFRERDDATPVVLMGYMNPIERFGAEAFAKAAGDAGVDGLITVDLPPEEAGKLGEALHAVEIDAIYLLSPTSPEARIRAVAERASGYIYYVSLKGVTGAATLDTAEVRERVAYLRGFTDLPIAVGFGIRDAESAGVVSRTADGVVVGSVLVDLIGEHGDRPDELKGALATLVGSMREAMDAS